MTLDFTAPSFAEANGIRMAYWDIGEGPAVVLCHGFPELAYSWKNVMPRLADAGFRVIAPDQRGYGQTDAPPNVEDYGLSELTADIAGLLDALGIDKAVWAGHDWGGPVVWTGALLQRERTAGIIGINTPYRPRGGQDPLEALREEWGDEHYIVNFHNKRPPDPDSSDAKFNANLEALFRGLYRKGAFDMEQFANLPKEQRVLQMEPLVFAENPPGEFILSEDELQFFLNAFQRNGVTPGINWYRNISANWRATEKADPKIHVPCLMIEVSDDPSGPPGCAEEMKPYIDDLEVARIEDCGHWTQHEKPDELADLMIDWLTRRFKN